MPRAVGRAGRSIFSKLPLSMSGRRGVPVTWLAGGRGAVRRRTRRFGHAALKPCSVFAPRRTTRRQRRSRLDLHCAAGREKQGGALLYPVEGIERPALVEYPIISAGDVCGSILFLADGEPTVPTEAEEKLLQAAAGFLGKQMEE